MFINTCPLARLRASFCSRLLYTCISSACFAGTQTMEQLNVAWVSQMKSLYEDGVEAGLDDQAFLPAGGIWQEALFRMAGLQR